MKLSNETVTVLKNFSTINQNLVIKAGNKLSTMSAMKNIVASADVQEDFPQDFAIYDLNEFLAALSLFEKIDLDFKDDFVVITEGGDSRRALQYWYSDPSVVTTRHARYFEQAFNGVVARMSLLCKLLGVTVPKDVKKAGGAL